MHERTLLDAVALMAAEAERGELSSPSPAAKALWAFVQEHGDEADVARIRRAVAYAIAGPWNWVENPDGSVTFTVDFRGEYPSFRRRVQEK